MPDAVTFENPPNQGPIDYSGDPAYSDYLKSGSKLPFSQWYNQTQKPFIPGVQAPIKPPLPNQSLVSPVTSYMSPLPNYNVNVKTPNNMFQTNPYSILGVFPNQFNQIGGQGTAQQNQQYVSPLGMYSPAGGTGFYQ